MRALDVCRDEWRDHQLACLARAEHDTRGQLLNSRHRDEFGRLFGFGTSGLHRLFRQPKKVRHRYASPELIGWWERHGHLTFEQFAYQAGFRHKFIVQARRRWQ